MLPPIIGLSSKDSGEDRSEEIMHRHDHDLISYLCDRLSLPVSSLLDFELFLYDLNAARISGLRREFISGRGLDNLGCCFCALQGLLGCSGLEEEPNIRLMVLFDNEEVGSDSLMGAGSTLLSHVIKSISTNTESVARRRSMVLSCVGQPWRSDS